MPDSPPGSTGPVAITGATGLIGSALVDALRRDGVEVRPVVRREPRPASGEIQWDPDSGWLDSALLEGVRAVVHLAGEPIGERWSPAKKDRIRSSRVEGTRLLSESIASLTLRPRVLVSASGIGYYGDRGDIRLDEGSGPGSDFLGRAGQAWEAATGPAEAAGVRVVRMRFGVVLHRAGGALARMLLPFRLGLGGTLGSGDQWMSWIALADLVDAIRFGITNDGMRGAVNAVAPEPVTNREFTRTLGRVLHRPALLRVPSIALRLVYGEMADATLLASQRAVPNRLLRAGFDFRYPVLEDALRAALGPPD